MQAKKNLGVVETPMSESNSVDLTELNGKLDLMLRLMRGLGFEAKREDFPLRCDDQIVYWNLVRAGLGIGGMQTLIADADPAVTRIARFVPLPPLPVWLTAPQALRHSPRIRRVFDHLSAGFKALRLDP